MSNSQLNKLKSGTKNGTEVTINLSTNVVDESNDETNFCHKLLLTNTQVSKIRKAFANGSSANIEFSKTHLSKMVQLGGFLMPGGVPDPIFDKMGNLLFKAALQVPGILDKIKKGENIPKTLLDAGYSFIINSKLLPGLLKGLGLTLMKVIRSLENRGMFFKGTTKKIQVKKEDFSIFLKH